ncbi:carbohydrate-binding protein [Streptomyces sp. SID4985]|uniref:carbohydrate-binding protein n=1 Tax=Streptomyces sp. SID4985 TaxID=2690292 RepID=UPI00136931EE|nr:carbohydrate-binding protein [Streptomyces sp. SID4985]MYQ47786.1 carbohydrate-binding protein [Streptomyces sp. SID4985]
MTPGDNGASTPEEDDPFGYLYADGQARGAQPPSGGYGYPNAVSRVRAVGERQYPQQQTYGQQVPQQQGTYGQPTAQYQAPAPQPQPGGLPTGSRMQQNAGRRGPNTKGLLIGAIAVVAAVVIGISVAMFNGDSGDEAKGGASPSPTQSQSTEPQPKATASAPPGELPKADAADASVQLAGGAAKASDVKGAQAAGGTYVGGLNQVGASVTWSVSVPEDGPYTFFMRYSATGEDQSMTVTVNGKDFGSKAGLRNYRHVADGDFKNGWVNSYVWPDLKKGANTLSVSCQAGDKCNVLMDQFWIKKGHVTR